MLDVTGQSRIVLGEVCICQAPPVSLKIVPEKAIARRDSGHFQAETTQRGAIGAKPLKGAVDFTPTRHIALTIAQFAARHVLFWKQNQPRAGGAW